MLPTFPNNGNGPQHSLDNAIPRIPPKSMWWVNVGLFKSFPVYVRVHIFDYLTVLLFVGAYFVINLFHPVKQDILLTNMAIRHHFTVSSIHPKVNVN
jgi:hypothetical protein